MQDVGKDKGRMERVAEGIYRRNGVYILPIWNPSKGRAGGKDWHSLPPGSTLAQARRLKRELEAEKANGRRRRGATTVAEWAGRYEQGGWVPGRWLQVRPRKAESTNIHNDSRIRAFAREFEGRTLESITEEEAAVFAQEHPSSYKEVHSMFNDARAMQFVDRNPFAGLRTPTRLGRKNIVVLTDAELEQLCGHARATHREYGPLFAAMIQTAAWTGLRPGELFLLSRERGEHLNFADLRKGLVHVEWQLDAKTGKVTRPKKESMRQIVLLPGAEEALRSVEAKPGEPVFVTKLGKRFTLRTLHYYWNPVRAAFVAALPAGHHLRTREEGDLDFYELRHFFGTKLANPPNGSARPQDIAKMMGHSDGGELAMRLYVHMEADEARDRIRNAWRRASWPSHAP